MSDIVDVFQQADYERGRIVMRGAPTVYEVTITAKKVGSSIIRLRQSVREGLFSDDYEPYIIEI